MSNKCEYMNSDWFKALEREVANSNKTIVALKMNVDRSTVSSVVHGLGPYGSGKATTKKFEEKFRQAYEQLTCIHTQAPVGIEYCREHALVSAPTQNPMRMMHWQTCQQCPHKPKPLTQDAKLQAGKAQQQQAGVIDKVTLPLPVVGAPQIQHNEEIVTC